MLPLDSRFSPGMDLADVLNVRALQEPSVKQLLDLVFSNTGIPDMAPGLDTTAWPELQVCIREDQSGGCCAGEQVHYFVTKTPKQVHCTTCFRWRSLATGATWAWRT